MHGKHPDLGNSVWRRVWKDSRASLNLKKKKEKKTVNEQQQQSTMYIYVLFFFLYASCKKPLLPFACGDDRKRAKEEYSWDLWVSHRMEGKRGRVGWTSDSYPAAEPFLSPGRRLFYGTRSGYKALLGSVFFFFPRLCLQRWPTAPVSQFRRRRWCLTI